MGGVRDVLQGWNAGRWGRSECGRTRRRCDRHGCGRFRLGSRRRCLRTRCRRRSGRVACVLPGDQAARRAVVQAALDEARRLQVGGEAAFSGRARVRFDMRRAAETLSFVACQARFMGARSWVMQAAVVIAAAFLALASGAHAVSGLYACLAAAAIAVCGLPQATASRLYGVVELERSCKHDARSVAAARMAVLACANARLSRQAFRMRTPIRRLSSRSCAPSRRTA